MPLAVLAFLIAVTYLPGLPSGATVGRWAVFAVGISIFLLKTPVLLSRAHVLGALLFVWIAAGFLWCLSGWDHAGGAFQFAVMGAAFLVGANQTTLDPMWRGFAAGVSVSGALAAVWWITGWSPADSLSPGAVGLFLTKNMAADAAVLALIGALGLHAWWLVPGPLVLLILSGSRTGLAALLVAALALVWINLTQRERRVAGPPLVALAVVAGAVAWWWILDADRQAIWASALGGMTFLGQGLGSFSIGNLRAEFAHNEFLHYGFELGAGSLLIWSIAVYGLYAAPVVERVALAAILAQCALWWPLHAPATAFVAALVAGYLAGHRVRADARQLVVRTADAGGIRDTELVGVGSLSAADLGRHDLPFRPQYTVGRR